MSLAVSKLHGKSVEFIIEKVRNYVTKMTGNANFTTPNPALAAVSSEVDDLELKFGAAMGGGKTLKTAVRLQKLKVLAIVSTLRAYVQTTTLGDMMKILSSGFDVRGHVVVNVLDPPSNVRVGFGKVPGQLIVRWAGVPHRTGYKVQISEALPGPPVWTDAPNGDTGKVRLEVDGLTPGKIYLFRVYTKSTAGYSGPGVVVAHMAA
jgi:hypothetical protein